MMHSNKQGAAGQVLPLFALFLVVLIGATAITADYGTWLKARRDYQNVADAAVLAGSGFLSRPIGEPKRILARRSAWKSLSDQLNLGLSDGDLNTLQTTNTAAGSPSVFSGYRLWVSTPPLGAGARYPGAFAGSADRYLFAWVEKDNPSFFSRIFQQGDQAVSAWATAGVFAGQFAVITLRRNGQSGPSNATDIDLAGTNTILRVANGDVGGNWGMKLNSGSNLELLGDSDAYLVDFTSCGNSCWSTNQVSDGSPSYNTKAVKQLPNLIDDPNYPLPAALTGVPPSGGTSLVPRAFGTTNSGDVTITGGAVLASPGVGCSANSPHIGPGWYHDITVRANSCLILDPTNTYLDPNNVGGKAAVLPAQRPGIFYVTGALDVGNGSLVVGDGVSIVLRETSNQPGMTTSGSAAIDINTGASDGVKGYQAGQLNQKKAAFQSDGSYSYTFDSVSSRWVYSADSSDKSKVGIAIYVIKPAQMGNSTSDAYTDMVKISAGAALSWQGVLYAPRDNITLAGQPRHDAIGQFICWTVKLAGGTTVTQTYDGPGEAAPRLVEPRLGQ